MKWSSFPPPLALAACLTVSVPAAFGLADDNASPIFGVTLPTGYRDWKVVSVAHEAGNNNDIRAILGNDIAIKAFRDGARPFPDGTIIARVAWKYVSSPENNAIFGQDQSFIAGSPTNVQISVKDARKYADTYGWGYAQFESGKVDHNETLIKTCAPCHARAPNKDDLVFTQYSP